MCVQELFAYDNVDRQIVAAGSIALAARGMGAAAVEGQPLDVLLKALGHGLDPRVRRASADALVLCGGAAASVAVLEKAAATDKAGDVRTAAQTALRKMPSHT